MKKWLSKVLGGKTNEDDHASGVGDDNSAGEVADRLRVDQTECKIVDLHKLEIAPEEIEERLKREGTGFSSLTLDYLQGLYLNLYLFDVWVSDIGATRLFISDITQPNDQGQAPYLEMYFDESGTEQLLADQPYMPEPPLEQTFPCRLRFYLHYVDLDVTLDIAGRFLDLPKPSPMPEWLAEKMPYQPPN